MTSIFSRKGKRTSAHVLPTSSRGQAYLLPMVAQAEALPVRGVDLGVGVDVPHALDVHHQVLPPRQHVREVAVVGGGGWVEKGRGSMEFGKVKMNNGKREKVHDNSFPGPFVVW